MAHHGVVAMGPTVPQLRSHQNRPRPLRRRAPYRPLVGRVLPPGPNRVVRRVLCHSWGNGSLRPGTRWSRVVSSASPMKCLSVTCKQLLLAPPIQVNFELLWLWVLDLKREGREQRNNERERERECVGIV